MIKYDTHEVISHVPTAEGALILKDGSHEARVWSVLPIKGETPMTPVQLKKAIGDETAKVGQGRAFKNGWISKEGDGLVKAVSLAPTYTSVAISNMVFKVSEIQDATQIDLQEIESTGTLQAGEKTLADLRKRKLVSQKCLYLTKVAVKFADSHVK